MHRYAAYYQPDEQRLVLIHGDGPYSWAVLFYRSYLNLAEAYSLTPIKASETQSLVDKILEDIKQKPAQRLGKTLDRTVWKKMGIRKDLPTDEFLGLFSENETSGKY